MICELNVYNIVYMPVYQVDMRKKFEKIFCYYATNRLICNRQKPNNYEKELDSRCNCCSVISFLLM